MNRRVFASFFACTVTGLAMAISGCPSSNSGSSGSTADSGAAASPAAGGSASPAASGSGDAAAPGGSVMLAFVTNNASDYWTIASHGVDKAKDELKGKVDVQFEIDSDGSAAMQKTIIDNLVSKGVKGIAISPKDPTNQVQLLNDTAKQAVVFTQDSDSPTSNRMCYIGTDNHAAGMQAGEALKKAIPGGGEVMIFVGSKDAQNAHDRISGLEDAIKGSNIKVIDVRTDEADHIKAKSNVSDTIVKYPKVAGLVGIWSYNGPAIASAVKDAGKTGQIKVVAFDQEDGTLQGIKDGIIDSTVVQDPYKFGYLAITDMYKVITKDSSFTVPANKQIFVPTELVTKTSVDGYWTNLKKLQGKS